MELKKEGSFVAAEQSSETYPLIDPNFASNRQRRLGRADIIIQKMEGLVRQNALHQVPTLYPDRDGKTQSYIVTPWVIWGARCIRGSMLKDLIEIDQIKKDVV